MDFKIVARELGRRGGKKTLDEYGKDHFRRMRRLSGEAKKRKKEADSNLPIDNRQSEE